GRLAAEPVAVESMLAMAGLKVTEANALLAIWRAHFLRRDGLRLITLITGDAYDALLPIAICPKPAETKRVLVLCIDFPTPEIDAKVRALVERLEAEGIDERDRAAAELIALGAIAASSIAKHADHPDPEVRARVAAVLEKLASPVPVPKPAVRPTRVKHR
ncbi:MAG: hypothetical protein HYY17_05615, partial [Planctomycetes bacterium]|nr:hypothetical protein [Planctomycetota bacterium]